MSAFGDFLREAREALRKQEPRYSLRQVAARIGVQPSYLSKVERGDVGPPSESDLQEVIRKRPRLFADVILQLKDMPDRAVLRLVREVRDGDW
jgi:transcriptional regulator with XRE-family HTH domain